MKEWVFQIGKIPAILYGEKTDKVYLFIHGKCGYKEEAKEFGEIVCPHGWQVLGIDLPEHGNRKGETNTFVPWYVVPELQTVMAYARQNWSCIALRANSIGAWFSMLAFSGRAAGEEPICFARPEHEEPDPNHDAASWYNGRRSSGIQDGSNRLW